MKKILLVALAIGFIGLIIFYPPPKPDDVVTIEVQETRQDYEPTHAQRVWVHALEWCESRGHKAAVNPLDRDGTPSYYSFQFKPSTFKMYSLRYEILQESDVDTTEELMDQLDDYNLQLRNVYNMLGDEKVKWQNEFPGCTKKIGLPPKY